MDAEFRISRLERLGEMLEKGLITEAEFAEEKRKLFAADVNEVLLPSDNLDGGGLPLGQAAANDRVEPISEGPSPASAKQATAFQSEQLVDDHGEDRGSPTLPPKLWKFFVGLAGIFLMGDATGLRRQSLILIGLLICGAAYLYKSRNGNVSWLPQLNVRLTGTIGAFFIILPILGNQIILNERPEQEARGNYSALNNSDANYSASESEKHRHDPFAKENENLTSDDHLIEYAKKYPFIPLTHVSPSAIQWAWTRNHLPAAQSSRSASSSNAFPMNKPALSISWQCALAGRCSTAPLAA